MQDAMQLSNFEILFSNRPDFITLGSWFPGGGFWYEICKNSFSLSGGHDSPPGSRYIKSSFGWLGGWRDGVFFRVI